MKKFIPSIFSLPLLLSVTAIHAETTRYNIEIVIFEDTTDRYLDSEQWPVIHHPEQLVSNETTLAESDIFPDIASKSTEAEYPENNSVINITHNTSNTLADHVNKLNQSSRYNVLLHQSWQQTGLGDTEAVNFQIDTDKKSRKNNTAMILTPDHPASTTENNDIKSSIQGTLKLILGRYLHIHTDLIYKRPKSAYRQNLPVLHSKPFNEFEIKSQRRMRSNELHYIDHPLLGILVTVSPIEASEPNKENKVRN